MFRAGARMRTRPSCATSDRPAKDSHDRHRRRSRVSGQVLVYQDLIGLNPGFKPKFLRTYANAFDIIQAALNAYDQDVKSGNFPNDNESYSQIHQVNRAVA